MAATIEKRFARRAGCIWPWALLVTAALQAAACDSGFYPDQSQFVPLDELADSGEAVARVYTAPVPVFGLFDVHSWFVVKRAAAGQFDRWESWVALDPPRGFI